MESGNPSVSIDLLVGSLLANGQFFFKKFRELPRALRVKTFELLTCCHTHRCAAIQTVVDLLYTKVMLNLIISLESMSPSIGRNLRYRIEFGLIICLNIIMLFVRQVVMPT